MQIRYVLWCGKTVSHHVMRKSRPHGCFYHDSPQRDGDTKLAPSKSVQGSPPSRQVAKVSQSTRLFKLMMQTRFWIFKFLRGHLLVAGVPWKRKELALRYFSKGSQKHLLAWGMCWVIWWLRPSFLLLWNEENTTLISAQDVWLQNSECSTCVSSNEFSDQHKHVRWVEHRAPC